MRLFALIVGLTVFVVDFCLKLWIQSNPQLRYDPIIVIPGLFRIDYLTNDGIAFGLLSESLSSWQPMVLSLIGITALLIVLYYLARMPAAGRLPLTAMGLLLGGILGNLTDRLLHRHVIDYLTLHWQGRIAWPTFNVADAAITVGVALLLADSLLERRRTRRSAAAVVGLMLGWGPAVQPGIEIETVVASLQREYQEVQTLRARFRQEVIDRGIRLQESGRLIMKKPGKMYWEYENPTSKYFVADGARTYFYVPADRQVFIQELDLTETDSPLLFLLGRGDLMRDFQIDFAEDPVPGGRILLQLRPRVPHPDFESLLLEIDGETMLIYRLSVVDPVGQHNDYLLTEIERNVEIPDSQFVLRYPSDVEEVHY